MVARAKKKLKRRIRNKEKQGIITNYHKPNMLVKPYDSKDFSYFACYVSPLNLWCVRYEKKSRMTKDE